MKGNELIHKGSVKDIYTGGNTEELLFLFSNRYSVFDWGEMPDQMPGKGIALASMGDLFFSLLGTPSTWQNWKVGIGLTHEEELILKELRHGGVDHHCLGLYKKDPTGLMVKKVNIIPPSFSGGKYNYKEYRNNPVNTLVPLEVVFRFGLPEGSSLLKRVGSIDYRRVLGLAEIPKAGDKFARPIIEYSTKLESTDRYLRYSEAQRIAGLNDFEFSKLHCLTSLIGLRLKDLFSEAGIDLWDGKFEFAYGPEREAQKRGFILVDSIGPDELRLVRNDQKLSKEFLREFYRDSDWLSQMELAKDMAMERGLEDWKSILIDELKCKPLPLNDEYRSIANAMYPSLANHLCQHFGHKKPFDAAMALEELEAMMKKCSR